MRRLVIGLFWLAAATLALHTAAGIRTAANDPDAAAVAAAVFLVLQLGVVVLFAALVTTRGESVRPNREPVAIAACAVALLAVAFMKAPAGATLSSVTWIGEALSMAGTAWVLVSVWFLGRCFGVLPEARGLVTRGPYRYVRHPVYLGELAAALGLVVASLNARNVVLGSLLLAAQVVRMRLEEAELTAAFPEYAAYARTTPRLIPGISPAVLHPDSRESAAAPRLRRATRT